jgi:CheY-like chemotaxis protein
MAEDLDAVLAGLPPRHAQALARGAAEPAPVAAPRVLLVDDDPLVFRIHQGSLTAAGFHPEAIYDGAVAVERIRRDPPALVLLDLVLPGLDGIDVLRRLRAESSLAGLPVIVFSNTFVEDEVRAAREAGADAVLPKAGTLPKALVAAVRRVLDHTPPVARRAAPASEIPLAVPNAAATGAAARVHAAHAAWSPRLTGDTALAPAALESFADECRDLATATTGVSAAGDLLALSEAVARHALRLGRAPAPAVARDLVRALTSAAAALEGAAAVAAGDAVVIAGSDALRTHIGAGLAKAGFTVAMTADIAAAQRQRRDTGLVAVELDAAAVAAMPRLRAAFPQARWLFISPLGDLAAVLPPPRGTGLVAWPAAPVEVALAAMLVLHG